MKVSVFRLLLALPFVLGLTSWSGVVLSQSTSVVQIASQGGGQCNNFAINNISQIPGTGNGQVDPGNGTLGSGSATASYTLSQNRQTFGFSSSSKPINFAVLKSNNLVRVFYYAPGGVTEDNGLVLNNSSPFNATAWQPINNVTLCYGQTGGTGPSTLPAALPTCNQVTNLDGTGVNCPDDLFEQRILVSFDPSRPTGDPVVCTCNLGDPAFGGGFKPCDANVEWDRAITPLRPAGYCGGDGPLKALPSKVEFGNDGTWTCRTIGGERQCWSR